MEKEYSFDTAKLLQELPSFSQKGITELALHDKNISSDKKLLLNFIKAVEEKSPELFVTIPVLPQVIDNSICLEAQKINCTLDISLEGTVKQNNGAGFVLLFDKKLYSNKASLLNNSELVFGFDMGWGVQQGDTSKLFRDRLDFAISLYPNHIYFEQLECNEKSLPTGIFSSKDLDYSRDLAFACKTFYTEGRAVPWFNIVLNALKITPCSFFADFAEWQRCSSCDIKSGFNPEETTHKEIEKMQLVFLKQKFEEKNKDQLWNAVEDVVKINGAFSRVASDGEESVIETSYNPDDILSPQIYDISKFCDNACLESCKVKVFASEDSPDYKIL